MSRFLTLCAAFFTILACSQNANSQVSPGAQTFPSLGMYAIQNNHDYDTGKQASGHDTGVLGREEISDIVIMNMWNGWRDPNTGATGLKTLQDLAAGTTRSTLPFAYFIPTESQAYEGSGACPTTSGGFPAAKAAIAAMNAFARVTYPSGAIVSADYNDCFLNVTAGGGTYGGRTWAQYAPDYAYDFYWNGGGLGLATDATDPVNHLWAGSYQDALYTNYPATADWQRSGSTNTGIPYQEMTGQMQISLRAKADGLGTMIGGNIAALPFQYGQATIYYGNQFDLGLLENMWGGTGCNTIECADSTAGFVQFYQQEMALLNSNKLAIFSAYNISPNGEDATDTTVPYQASRAALAACVVLGNARCDLQSSANSIDANAALWFDEYAVNRTTGAPCTTPNTSCAAYIGYLGTAVDSPQTAAYQGCYWRRRFQYGEVWWSPKDCSAGTINFGYTVNFIAGVQASSFNTGGSGASHPIGSRDGIFVLYQNGSAPAAPAAPAATPIPNPPTGVSLTK